MLKPLVDGNMTSSGPTTVVILVVDYISEPTIHSLYVHPFCVKEMYNTSFIVNLVLQIVQNFKYFYFWGHHHIVEHLHDIMALQINNFNSFFSSCNNLRGLSGKDNILWMMVASKCCLPYIWLNEYQVVVVSLYTN